MTYPATGIPSKFQKKVAESTANLNLPPQSKEDQEKTTALALNILGSFKFDGHILTEFLRDCVVHYLSDLNLLIRREAAVCCCKLMAGASGHITHGYFAKVVSEVLEQLLAVGIADSDASIRSTGNVGDR